MKLKPPQCIINMHIHVCEGGGGFKWTTSCRYQGNVMGSLTNGALEKLAASLFD